MKYTLSQKDFDELASIIHKPEKVKSSVIYGAAQTATWFDISLMAGAEKVNLKALSLIAEIAASSPTIRIIDISGHDLTIHGLIIASTLAGSNIDAIIISASKLGACSLEIARMLACSGIHMIDMSFNDCTQYGIDVSEVAEIFINHNKSVLDTKTWMQNILPGSLVEIVSAYASLQTKRYNVADALEQCDIPKYCNIKNYYKELDSIDNPIIVSKVGALVPQVSGEASAPVPPISPTGLQVSPPANTATPVQQVTSIVLPDSTQANTTSLQDSLPVQVLDSAYNGDSISNTVGMVVAIAGAYALGTGLDMVLNHPPL